jgi:chromosome segregation ATPase
VDAPKLPSGAASSRLSDAHGALFSAFDEELTRQVSDARSEVATALGAQIEVLREQLRDVQDQSRQRQQALEVSEQRAEKAEHSLRLATEAAEKAKAESDAELKRVGEAGALVSSELLTTSEAAEKLREENAQLSDQVQREQQLRESSQQEMRLAQEHRQRAEEQLLDTAARGALERDSLSVAARAREEALFERLVDVQSRTQAALDAARAQS